jgi:predicted transcriptional regulator
MDSPLASSEDILISLHKKYVQRMLDGTKSIELRRRALHVSGGTRVWIYSKSPYAVVEAFAIIDRVIRAKPRDLWNEYKDRVGISKSDFESYFLDVSMGCALVLRDIQRLPYSVSLSEIRDHASSFQPPQFFVRLGASHPALKALRMKGTSRSANRTPAHAR